MFKKATKKQCKLRLGLMGIAGSGKTYSALRLATGIGGKIAFIDTERRSASKYSDKFDFDVCDIDDPTPENIIAAVTTAEQAGYNVLIIDSTTHAWQKVLELIEKLTRERFDGNSFRAWGVGTPIQRKFIDTILKSKMHIIGTMRAKTEYVMTTNEKGKSVPKRVGMGAEQGKDIEYEFDLLMLLDNNHSATVIKDRSGKYQDEYIELLDEKMGKELAEWLSDGEEEAEPIEQPLDTLKRVLKEEGINLKDFCAKFEIKHSNVAEKIEGLDFMIAEFKELG